MGSAPAPGGVNRALAVHDCAGHCARCRARRRLCSARGRAEQQPRRLRSPSAGFGDWVKLVPRFPVRFSRFSCC